MRTNVYQKNRIVCLLLVCCVALTGHCWAASKVHTVVLGKWTSAQWSAGSSLNEKPITLKVRPLVVDGRVKEYVMGSAHDVTDRLFVVRRVFRVNDSLPEESGTKWQWQRGGWLLIDRVTGHVSPINLPEFDAFYSAASWYRDYVAYCGVSDDGKKVYAVVAQINRRKAVLKKMMPGEGLQEDAGPDSACAPPLWQRGPMRVSFELAGTKQTFAVRGHVVDLVDDSDEDE